MLVKIVKINFNPLTAGVTGWISDSYCSIMPLCSGMGEVVPARTSPTLLPHPLALCCHYPVSKYRSASIVMTSTVRVKKGEYADSVNIKYDRAECGRPLFLRAIDTAYKCMHVTEL